MHDDIHPVEPALEEPRISFELERVRHDPRGICQHAILGNDGVTLDAAYHVGYLPAVA